MKTEKTERKQKEKEKQEKKTEKTNSKKSARGSKCSVFFQQFTPRIPFWISKRSHFVRLSFAFWALVRAPVKKIPTLLIHISPQRGSQKVLAISYSTN